MTSVWRSVSFCMIPIICVYVCILYCVFVSMSVFMYSYICWHASLYFWMFVCMHFLYVCEYVYECMCVCMCVCMYDDDEKFYSKRQPLVRRTFRIGWQTFSNVWPIALASSIPSQLQCPIGRTPPRKTSKRHTGVLVWGGSGPSHTCWYHIKCDSFVVHTLTT